MKKLPLYIQIILGMVLGVVFALIMTNFDFGKDLFKIGLSLLVKYLSVLLKLIAVPLILASLIKGVSDLKDISKLSKMGGRTIGTYIVTTVLAVSIGLIVVNAIQPGKYIDEGTRTELIESNQEKANSKIEASAKQKEAGPLQALEDLVPSNIFQAASSNRNMLQVIFFAVFFGIGLILIPEKKSKPVTAFFDGFNEVILKMVDLIMLAAPYGVFALLAALIVESPSLALFKALGCMQCVLY